ncbi:MAG: hypothetical protein JWO97_3683 [Acidobacteria bacterium]|nr:hypothetical protein [Acidobacteriota bacterium]
MRRRSAARRKGCERRWSSTPHTSLSLRERVAEGRVRGFAPSGGCESAAPLIRASRTFSRREKDVYPRVIFTTRKGFSAVRARTRNPGSDIARNNNDIGSENNMPYHR